MQDRLHHRGNVSYTLCEQYSLGPFTLPSIQWPLRWMKETRQTRTALKTSDAIIWAETRSAFPCQHFRKFRSRNKWNTSAVSVEISGQSGPSDPTETCRSISKTSCFQSYFVLSSNQNFGRSANGYRSGSIFFQSNNVVTFSNNFTGFWLFGLTKWEALEVFYHSQRDLTGEFLKTIPGF